MYFEIVASMVYGLYFAITIGNESMIFKNLGPFHGVPGRLHRLHHALGARDEEQADRGDRGSLRVIRQFYHIFDH